MSEQNSLAGEYTLKVGMSLGDGSHKVPGDRVTLSDEDAKRFLAEGNVVDPTVDPEGDPHDSADHILTRPEFLRWMDCQYPRYVEDRKAKRERNRIVEKILRNPAQNAPAPDAVVDIKPDTKVDTAPAVDAPKASEPEAKAQDTTIDIPDGDPDVTATIVPVDPPSVEPAPTQETPKKSRRSPPLS